MVPSDVPCPDVPGDVPCWALLSVLGVQGWGPLHLLLKRDADPAEIAGRLRRSLGQAGLPVSGCDVPAGRLLAALLRSQGDLDPVLAPGDGTLLRALRYRHRLVGRQAGGLIIRSWEQGWGNSSGHAGWCCLGPARRLEAFLQSPRAQPEAGPPTSKSCPSGDQGRPA